MLVFLLVALIFLTAWWCWLIRVLVVGVVMRFRIERIPTIRLMRWLWLIRLCWSAGIVGVLLVRGMLFNVGFIMAVRVVDVFYRILRRIR